ncbi:hypothetical protein R3P38DRAFT_2783092 [Favolaschia claudopus]|uniref:Uncharacterized protein n=1 Tax=Favolaschia claudopus TaxID=2862362 RepID=A0AAW0B1Z7_9AGAR
MDFPTLLFSSYHVEISVDITLQQQQVPGIGIPGKVLVAQITEKLAVIMVGALGHEQPLLSLVDWRAPSYEVQPASSSVLFHFANIQPVGTLSHSIGIGEPCSFSVRVALDQTTFWKFAYLVVKPLAPSPDIVAEVQTNLAHIGQMLEYFKFHNGQDDLTQDNGPVAAVAAVEGEAPPDYRAIGEQLLFHIGVNDGVT